MNIESISYAALIAYYVESQRSTLFVLILYHRRWERHHHVQYFHENLNDYALDRISVMIRTRYERNEVAHLFYRHKNGDAP